MQQSWEIAIVIGLTFFGASAEAQTTVTESGDNFGPPPYKYSTCLSAGKSVKFVGKMSYNSNPSDYGDEVQFKICSAGSVSFKQSGPVRAYIQVYKLNSNGSKTYLNTLTTNDLSGTLQTGTYGIVFTLNARQTDYAITVSR